MSLNFPEKRNTDKYCTTWTIYVFLEKVTALYLHLCFPPPKIKKRICGAAVRKPPCRVGLKLFKS